MSLVCIGGKVAVVCVCIFCQHHHPLVVLKSNVSPVRHTQHSFCGFCFSDPSVRIDLAGLRSRSKALFHNLAFSGGVGGSRRVVLDHHQPLEVRFSCV